MLLVVHSTLPVVMFSPAPPNMQLRIQNISHEVFVWLAKILHDSRGLCARGEQARRGLEVGLYLALCIRFPAPAVLAGIPFGGEGRRCPWNCWTKNRVTQDGKCHSGMGLGAPEGKHTTLARQYRELYLLFMNTWISVKWHSGKRSSLS